MFNDLYQKFIDKEMKEYKEEIIDLTILMSHIGGYTNALRDMKEFNNETNSILDKTLMVLLDDIIEDGVVN